MEKMFHVPLVAASYIKLLIDGGDVQNNQLVNVQYVGECSHHDSPSSHAVARQADNTKIQFAHEAGQVRSHKTVSHLFDMRTVTMVTCVYAYNTSSYDRSSTCHKKLKPTEIILPVVL